ncbi:hypothetical protein JZ751_026108 [Albula glossodonta]|uniref:Hexosyltransferase n=1 Tax=Albula glossodonta TaxID=121402 RepID=A0A8T2MPZ8_9TELE|nr:hypothetical protein JZ751_026108 [Albula glossodonta]
MELKATFYRTMMILKPRNTSLFMYCAMLLMLFLFCLLIRMDGTSMLTQTHKNPPSRSSMIRDKTELNRTAPKIHLECRNNGSLLQIPNGIPVLHQLFLQYKHCRTFRQLLSPKACSNDLFLLMAIKSTAAQIDRRAALRSTWGREGLFSGMRVQLVFLLGRSMDRVGGHPLQPLLHYESRQFGDILQWDFDDSFFNLTLKEVHFLNWFSRECRTAQFVLKGDDDVFVNTGNLLEYLWDKRPNDHLFVGDIISKAVPIRNIRRKYFIPMQMYPKKQYPPYAGGGGYLMSRRTVIGLDRAAQDTDLFPIDDVFVGMCLEKMNVTLVFHDGFRTFGFRQMVTPFNPCIYRGLMLIHKLSPAQMWAMWSLVNDPDLTCTRKFSINV